MGNNSNYTPGMHVIKSYPCFIQVTAVNTYCIVQVLENSDMIVFSVQCVYIVIL